MPDSKHELHRFQTLLDAARLLNSTLELKEVTQIILDVVRAEVEVERVSVFVVDREGKTLHCLIAQEVDDYDLTLPIGKGIAGVVAATGDVLDVPDAYADARFDRRFDQKLHFYTHDIFSLPVYNRHGAIVGVLELLNRARQITETDREFLFGISVYIGLALQNAWSHTQVRKKGEHQHELFSLRDHLAETEQLSLTSELFQHVVQEISNPLAEAISYAELATNLEPLPKELRAYLEKITQGLDRTATAVRTFRQFVRGEDRERTPLSLLEVLRRISDLRSEEWARHHIEATLFTQPVPEVLADERQIQLVILYLLRSAEQSLLKTEGKRELRLQLSGTEDVRIEVRDTGPARSTPVQQNLTRLSQGFPGSFDLAIAASIVAQHGGHMKVERTDRGNSVIIDLPAYSKDTAI